MKLIVGINTISIDKKDILNSGEYNIHEIEFAFDEAYNGLVKKAVFSDDLHTYQVSIVENKCQMPYEILEKEQNINIGVYAYEVSGDDLVLRYSPKPLTTYVNKGSYKEHYDNWEEITPTDKEQIEQMVANINIDGSKSGSITTITITYKDGTTKQLTLEDGKSIEYNWEGTFLGIRQEGESEYQYVNLKGDKGEAGAIQMLIVNELPIIGNENAIYLVPNSDPQTSNYYDEYVYVNSAWEKLGGVSVQIDLTDYVKNTDYATASKGGVIKSGYYGLQVDSSNGKAYCDTYTYANYGGLDNQRFISKGTLENVITGKGLTTKSYVDGLVGDINDALDSINGESV